MKAEGCSNAELSSPAGSVVPWPSPFRLHQGRIPGSTRHLLRLCHHPFPLGQDPVLLALLTDGLFRIFSTPILKALVHHYSRFRLVAADGSWYSLYLITTSSFQLLPSLASHSGLSVQPPASMLPLPYWLAPAPTWTTLFEPSRFGSCCTAHSSLRRLIHVSEPRKLQHCSVSVYKARVHRLRDFRQ